MGMQTKWTSWNGGQTSECNDVKEKGETGLADLSFYHHMDMRRGRSKSMFKRSCPVATPASKVKL
jgi:hypothetical protein